VAVKITRDAFSVELDDGRTITVPIGWYPRIAHASSRERRNWRLIGTGEGIHWPELDEDVSVEGILHGRPSAESQASFERWLSSRESSAGKRMPPVRARAAGSAAPGRIRG
jgi:hypothetical protein